MAGKDGKTACWPVAVLLAAGWAATAPAEPRFPGGFQVEHSQAANASWRETGTLPEVYDSAMRSLRSALEGQGYALRCEIPLAAGENPKTLMQWENGTERIIVMLWSNADGTTGCSWGVSE